MENELLTWRESVKVFIDAGLSESTFRRRVQKGIVSAVPTGNRKQGSHYPRKQVLAAAGVVIPREPVDVKFVKVTPETMPEMVPVLESVFTGSPNIERWQAWIRRNGDIAYMLKIDGKAVGVGLVVPLSQKKIDSILAQQVTPPTEVEEILLYEPGVPVNLYIRSVGIIATATHAQKRRWAGILVRGFLRVLIDLGMRGIVIDKIYSRSETADGRRILRHMGFAMIPSVTKHDNYMIDVGTTGLKVIDLYRQALNEWKQGHGWE